MAAIRRFEDIEAWRSARAFTKTMYTISDRGRFARDFGLRDQIRRSAVSVMANIAEGFERNGNQEFIHSACTLPKHHRGKSVRISTWRGTKSTSP